MITVRDFLLEKAREINHTPNVSLVEEWIEEYTNPFRTKAEKWDKLEEKIAKFYVDENGDELSEDDSENIYLATIGEIAASAFGWL